MEPTLDNGNILSSNDTTNSIYESLPQGQNQNLSQPISQNPMAQNQNPFIAQTNMQNPFLTQANAQNPLLGMPYQTYNMQGINQQPQPMYQNTFGQNGSSNSISNIAYNKFNDQNGGSVNNNRIASNSFCYYNQQNGTNYGMNQVANGATNSCIMGNAPYGENNQTLWPYNNESMIGNANVQSTVDNGIIPNSSISFAANNAGGQGVETKTTWKKKDSILSLISCLLAGITFILPSPLILYPIVGVASIVLGCVDLSMKDKTKRHLGSYVGIVLGIVLCVYFGIEMGHVQKNVQKAVDDIIGNNSTEANSDIEDYINEVPDVDWASLETNSYETKNSTVHIGEEFGNHTIVGKVIYVDLDYKDYNDMLTTVDEGYKAVLVRIKMINISDNSNYVSVGDFNCYADNISMDADFWSSDDNYNAYIEAGRGAILGAVYIVPMETKSIELEYDPLGERADRQIIIIQDEETAENVLIAEDESIYIKNSAMDNIKTIGIGDEFGNKTITGMVTEVNLDYTGYNEYWTTVGDNEKAIYLKIKVTNESNESNYVSVGDYSCYIDDIIYSAELLSGGNEDYNANIDPGRSAILGALYVIPKDANSIELEYNPLGESAERVIIKIQ
ncbi:MAG: hypothetical protein MJ105_05660 [Lachnospiraceae bacterium]|nr:hypothetical protein [Lachnospiraceae bacterium]